MRTANRCFSLGKQQLANSLSGHSQRNNFTNLWILWKAEQSLQGSIPPAVPVWLSVPSFRHNHFTLALQHSSYKNFSKPLVLIQLHSQEDLAIRRIWHSVIKGTRLRDDGFVWAFQYRSMQSKVGQKALGPILACHFDGIPLVFEPVSPAQEVMGCPSLYFSTQDPETTISLGSFQSILLGNLFRKHIRSRTCARC